MKGILLISHGAMAEGVKETTEILLHLDCKNQKVQKVFEKDFSVLLQSWIKEMEYGYSRIYLVGPHVISVLF